MQESGIWALEATLKKCWHVYSLNNVHRKIFMQNSCRGSSALIKQNSMDVVASGPPAFTLQQAVNIARDHYGLDVTAAVLVSERDQNFRLASDDGKRYVLKIANALAARLRKMDHKWCSA